MKMEFSWKGLAPENVVPEGTLPTTGASPDLRPGLMNAVASRLGTQSNAARFALCMALACLVGCNDGKSDAKAEAPPAATVVPDLDSNNFKVDHPEQFPLVTAVEHKAAPQLNVTGVVQPDINRAVPVVSLASGRVVEIKARLGDTVEKGQLLLKVRSNDVSGAYDTYLKAANDERLARLQLERAQILYDKGAIAKSALEQADD
ncbi:MAG: efflux RND transporter periplasmic adaptor subunit, partial [Candidatus Sulfotelmatobacter sp.]